MRFVVLLADFSVLDQPLLLCDLNAHWPTAAHCQDLGQQPLLRFHKFFFYILVLVLETWYAMPLVVLSHQFDHRTL